MRQGARTKGAQTPEELETLLEDAFVIRDGDALAALFDDAAVLVADGGAQFRGGGQIARFAATLWQRDGTYVADLERVVQVRDLALVVAGQGLSVVRRGSDGSWRYVISLMSLEEPTRKEQR